MAQEIARGEQVLESFDEAWRRPLALRRHHAGHFEQTGAVAVGGRIQQRDDRSFALALENAIDGPSSVIEQIRRDERCTMTADEHEGFRSDRFRRLRQVDDFGHVGEVVVRDRDGIRPPFPHHSRDNSRPVPPGGRLTARHAPRAVPMQRSARSPAAPAAGRSWCTSTDWDERRGFSL